MRTLHYSCIGILSLLTISLSIEADIQRPNASKKIILSNTQAMSYRSSDNGDFYLQTASFKVFNNALNYKNLLSTKTPYPISIKKHHKIYSVLVGPMQTAAAMKTQASAIWGKDTAMHHSQGAIAYKPTPITTKSDVKTNYASKMGPVLMDQDLRPFVSAEGLFSWPQIHGYTVTLPAPDTNTGQSVIHNRGWGARVAAGLLYAKTERFAYSGEIGWGYYGHTQMPITFASPLTATQIADGIGNTTGSLDRWGFDALIGLYYTQPKYDLYAKAGALFQNLRVSLANLPINASGGSMTINSTDPGVLPEIKLGGAYHITNNLAANLSWMYAFGGPFDVTLPYENMNSIAKIGMIATQIKNPTMNIVMFGLEYRFS